MVYLIFSTVTSLQSIMRNLSVWPSEVHQPKMTPKIALRGECYTASTRHWSMCQRQIDKRWSVFGRIII